MQITLTQDEIQEAVVAFVRGQITIAENQQIEVDFTAGRSPNGLTATLQISTVAAAPVPVPAPKPLAKPVAQSPFKKPVEETVQEDPAPEVEANISTGEERLEPEPESTSTAEDDGVAEEAPAAEEPVLVKKTSPFSKAVSDNVDAAPEPEKPATKSIFTKSA